MTTPDDARLITVEELSESLQIPVATLYRWRSRGEGPQGIRLGRHLRYRLGDVDRWLDAHLTPLP